MRDDLVAFFLSPKTPRQNQYEAVRAYVLDGLPAEQAARRFGFSKSSLLSLLRDFRAGKLVFFPQPASGPKDRRVTPHLRDRICELRRRDLSAVDIVAQLGVEDVRLSASTVERVLKDEGFGKLPRRSAAQRGMGKSNTVIPEVAAHLDLATLEPFRAECQVAGVFFFLPYILESGIVDSMNRLPLPQSSAIGKVQAGLSLLCLKLIGGGRLSHVRTYDHDRGFGLFAGLNVLPKPTYMGTYSCRVSASLCRQLQEAIVSDFIRREPSLFAGKTINLDFHAIPHFGDQSQMEKVWCGARNKALKGAHTFFAQDGESGTLLYTNAEVTRKEGAKEILRFVDYLKAIKGVVNETLVFDSHLTNYTALGELDEAGVKFITLRRRGKKLIEQTTAIADSNWQKVKLPIPKRKHQKFLAYESEVSLKGCPKPLRQIVMKDHGRTQPTFVVTNNRALKLVDVLTIYARRWRIENKLAELVGFFNLNALSSPIMARIYFDLLLTIMADLLYHRFAQDLPRFEKKLAPDIFRRFVDMPGRIHYDGERFEIQIRKRAHTPILLGVEKLSKPIPIPWLDNRPLEIVWKS